MTSDDVERARGLWLEAQSFAELCALGASFARGEIAYFPGWGAGSLDVESDGLRHVLARLNERGLLTVASQPGAAPQRAADGRESAARPFVAGIATPRFARALASLRAPLRACAHALGGAQGRDEAMTIVDGEPRVLAGRNALADELELWSGEVSRPAFDELSRLLWTCAWDERFGARADLWRALDAVADADE